jgi:hypothetical protein
MTNPTSMRTQLTKALFLLFAFCALLDVNTFAQRKPTDPKHENHYQATPVDTDEVSISFSDAHSQQEFTTAKIKVMNKTSDYILFKTNESAFKYDFGEYHPSVGGFFRGSKMMVAPKDSDTRILKVTGGSKFHVESLTLVLNGFNRVSSEGKVADAPDFKLPAAVNDFKAGAFKCSLEKIKKETKETEVTFKCVYQGNDIGIVDPSKITLKLENGQEYANDNRKSKAELVLPGEDVNFTASFHVPGKITDMQFANMLLVWKNTFTESKIVPITVGTSTLTIDPGMTEAKNK